MTICLRDPNFENPSDCHVIPQSHSRRSGPPSPFLQSGGFRTCIHRLQFHVRLRCRLVKGSLRRKREKMDAVIHALPRQPPPCFSLVQMDSSSRATDLHRLKPLAVDNTLYVRSLCSTEVCRSACGDPETTNLSRFLICFLFRICGTRV